MTAPRAGAAALLWVLAAAAGCGGAGREPPPEAATAEAEPGTADAESASADVEPASAEAEPADHDADPTEPATATPEASATPGASPGTPPTLATVEAAPVQGRSGPGDRPFEVALRTPSRVGHHRRIGRKTFEISLRSTELVHYPCASCHVPGEPVVQSERIADAHRDVRPVHPAESGARCLSCHAVDDVERLELASGERVTLDHAYRLCAQCHASQADAWANGAHGKRLDGWRGRRVLMGCADCHDPHRPAVGRRIPFPGPIIPRTGGVKR